MFYFRPSIGGTSHTRPSRSSAEVARCSTSAVAAAMGRNFSSSWGGGLEGTISGWWCNFTILKNAGLRQVGKDDIPYMKWKIIHMFETTNQIYVQTKTHLYKYKNWKIQPPIPIYSNGSLICHFQLLI